MDICYSAASTSNDLSDVTINQGMINGNGEKEEEKGESRDHVGYQGISDIPAEGTDIKFSVHAHGKADNGRSKWKPHREGVHDGLIGATNSGFGNGIADGEEKEKAEDAGVPNATGGELLQEAHAGAGEVRPRRPYPVAALGR